MAKGKGSKEHYNTTETTKVGDILLAAQSLDGKSYERGWPAEKSMHINRGPEKGGSKK